LLVTAAPHYTTSRSIGYVPNMPVSRALFNIIDRKGVKHLLLDGQRAKKRK
jgi:hypothetical protein